MQVEASGIEERGGETMKLDLRECAAAAAGSSQGFKRKENETRVANGEDKAQQTTPRSGNQTGKT